jgi:hypothetical protein
MFIVLVAMLFVACAKPFQPPPPEYKMWSKRGASELDIKKALLECGKPSPDPTFDSYKYAFGLEDDDSQYNAIFLTDACMEKASYQPRVYTVKQSCSWDRYKHLPACQPGAEIPTPSVERRLNSWHCKIKTDYDYCLKHAVNPGACNPEGHKKPPPECLP